MRYVLDFWNMPFKKAMPVAVISGHILYNRQTAVPCKTPVENEERTIHGLSKTTEKHNQCL